VLARKKSGKRSVIVRSGELRLGFQTFVCLLRSNVLQLSIEITLTLQTQGVLYPVTSVTIEPYFYVSEPAIDDCMDTKISTRNMKSRI